MTGSLALTGFQYDQEIHAEAGPGLVQSIRNNQMNIKFTKMHSVGNDFVMLNGIAEDIRITRGVVRYIADRHFGVGCDQVIVAEKPRTGKSFRMRIFNRDGSEAGQCGNGARCFAQFLRDESLIGNEVVCIETCTTEMKLDVNDDGTVTTRMRQPDFEPGKIPLRIPKVALKYRVDTILGEIEFSALSVGNPHCVVAVDDVEAVDVGALGPLMENHEVFPESANIGFSQTVSSTQIKLRVHERGSGETLGCGSGACAAVVAGIRNNELDSDVTVTQPGGNIQVNWEGEGAPVFLRGPVHHVFDGDIEIPAQFQ